MNSLYLNNHTVNLIALLLLMGVLVVMLLFNSYSFFSNKDKILGYYNVYLLTSLIFCSWNLGKVIESGSTESLVVVNTVYEFLSALAGLAYLIFFGYVFELSRAKRFIRLIWRISVAIMVVQLFLLILVLFTREQSFFHPTLLLTVVLLVTVSALILLIYALALKNKTIFQKIIAGGALLFYLLIFVSNLQEYQASEGKSIDLNILFIALLLEHLIFAVASASRIAGIQRESERLKLINVQYQLEIEQITNFFSLRISQQHTIDEMLADVSKNLIGKLGFEDCMIYVWNSDQTVLLQKAGYGIKGSMQIEMDENMYHIPKGKGIVGAAVETGKPIVANDTSVDNRYFTVDAKLRLSELCVPIIKNNQVLGAINTEHSKKNFYTERHLQILTTIASMLGDKMEMIGAQQQTREKEMEVLKLNKDLSDWQLSALRSQMNPHFIFNAMNSIQQFTLAGDVENANHYISKFSMLLRKVLKSSQESWLPLEEEIQILGLYLDIEKLRMGDDFVYEIITAYDVETDACRIPGMLIQPIAENSLKHGLGAKKGRKELKIEFSLKTDDSLLVSITDNGIGREQSEMLKSKGTRLLPHESRGISLIKERLKAISKNFDDSCLQIDDLVDNNNQASGTRVRLILPLADT